MDAHNIYKAEKGLIRIKCNIENGEIAGMRITGDFFLVPEEDISKLETLLTGKQFSQEGVSSALDSFYELSVQTPSVNRKDFEVAILGAKYENATA